jgi:C-terminal processing protease CtpA/Prc
VIYIFELNYSLPSFYVQLNVVIFQASGMKEGDFIVGIAEEDVKWSPHEEVVALIKTSGNNLNLRIVTPVDNRHTTIGKVYLKRLVPV